LEKLQQRKDKAKVIGGLPVGMKFDPQQGKRLQEFMSVVAEKLFRVLKPGGFFLCFSQGRLYHRMVVAIEEAGFEIRDMLI
jgi:site-specific DNA-methyltransferase (adenine-specific)